MRYKQSIAITLGVVFTAAAVIYLFLTKTTEQAGRDGMVNPAHEDRRLTTEPMPAFSDRPLSLPANNAVGTYTPETQDESASSSDDSTRQ